MEMGQYHACGRGMDITKCHLCLLQPGQRTINTQWHFIVFLSCHRRILLLKVFARSLMLRINSAGRRRIWPRLCVQLPSLINFFFFGSLRKCASSVLIGKFFPRVQHGVNQSDTNCKKKPKKGPQSSTKNLGHVSQRDDGAKKDWAPSRDACEGAVYINVKCSNYKECFGARGRLP